MLTKKRERETKRKCFIWPFFVGHLVEAAKTMKRIEDHQSTSQKKNWPLRSCLPFKIPENRELFSLPTTTNLESIYRNSTSPSGYSLNPPEFLSKKSTGKKPERFSLVCWPRNLNPTPNKLLQYLTIQTRTWIYCSSRTWLKWLQSVIFMENSKPKQNNPPIFL